MVTVEVDAEHGQSLSRLLDFLERSRPRQQDHLRRNLCTGNPDLLARDGIPVCRLGRQRLELECFEACIRLRDTEAGAPCAVDDVRDSGLYLLLGPKSSEWLCRVDICVNSLRTGDSSTGLRDSLHHHGGLGDS